MKYIPCMLALCISWVSFAQHTSGEKLLKFRELQMHCHFNGKHEKSLHYFDSILSVSDTPKSEAYNMAFISCDLLIKSGKRTSYPDLHKKLDQISKLIKARDEPVRKNNRLREPEDAPFLKNTYVEKKAYTKADIQPQYKGGMAAFYKYIAKNMNYPGEARRLGIEGRVYVQFIVTKEGAITDVRTVKGIGFGCDREAERVIAASHDWTPGFSNKKPVDVRMVLPIIYKLSGKKKRKKG